MNCLDKLVKNIEFNGKKQKTSNLKKLGVLAVLGAAIGGIIALLSTQGCCEKTSSIIFRNVDDIDDDINKNRDEIKQTLEKVEAESLGDVGVAMENALDNSEDKKENDNEVQ
jgi:hypothetical protein